MSTLSVDTIQGQTVAGNVKMPAGHVIQVKSAETSVQLTLNSNQSTQTDVGLAVSITPKYSNSKIYVSYDSGQNFTVIDTIYTQDSIHDQENNSNINFIYDWIAPAQVYNQCMFKIEVVDLVGLMGADTSNQFNIYDNDL